LEKFIIDSEQGCEGKGQQCFTNIHGKFMLVQNTLYERHRFVKDIVSCEEAGETNFILFLFSQRLLKPWNDADYPY